MNKLTLTRSYFNCGQIIFLIFTLVGIFSHLKSDSVPEGLLFKVWVIIYATPFIFGYLCYEFYQV